MAVSAPVGRLLSFVKKARLTQLKWSQKTKPGLCSGHLPGLATFQNLYPRDCPPLSSRGFCLCTLNSRLTFSLQCLQSAPPHLLVFCPLPCPHLLALLPHTPCVVLSLTNGSTARFDSSHYWSLLFIDHLLWGLSLCENFVFHF